MAASAMPRPTVYYIRHGETDWNVAGRLQGRRDVPLNARGRAQGSHCGEILRGLFARDNRDPAGLDYVSSPLARACQTMELARAALGLGAQGYRREPRLVEIARARSRPTRPARARQMAFRAAGRRELRNGVGAHR